MLQKLRMTVVGLVLVGGAVFMSWTYFMGSPELHVLAPKGSSVQVHVDGVPVSPDKTVERHLTFHVKQGEHAVRVVDEASGTTRDYTVRMDNGFAERVLPATASQCFARFDVTNTLYEKSGSAKQPPRLTSRFPSDGPFELESGTSLTFTELPSSLKRGRRAHLLVDLDCSVASGTESEVAEAAGF